MGRTKAQSFSPSPDEWFFCEMCIMDLTTPSSLLATTFFGLLPTSMLTQTLRRCTPCWQPHSSLSTVFSIQLHAQKNRDNRKGSTESVFFIVATVLPGKSRPSHLLHLLVLSLMPLDDAWWWDKNLPKEPHNVECWMNYCADYYLN